MRSAKTYAGSQRIAVRSGASAETYLLSDHLGSTNTSANNSGAWVGTDRYKAWGESRYASGSIPTNRRYTGQYKESSLGGVEGLYYYGARWYDPALGRFAQADTIIPSMDNPQSWDRYAGMMNNPTTYNDPSGHCPWCLVGAIIGAAVGYGAQVYNNYQNGYTGASAWTQNISAAPIVGGAIVGATVVAAIPVVAAAAGDVLVGAGLATGAAEGTGVGLGLASAGTAAYGLSQTTANVIYPASYPTLVIDSTVMPNIANNIQNAQSNGAPTVLTRTTDPALIAANRAAATAGFTGSGSPDEYPFASTYEGGAGSFVSGVPIQEQHIQGGVLQQFYKQNGIVDVSKFKVTVK